MMFKITANEFQWAELNERRNYYREFVVASLEERLGRLRELSEYSSWRWPAEERKRLEAEIDTAQQTIREIEAQMRTLGPDADKAEGEYMDWQDAENSA
jgi:hypothetical protein